MRHNAAIPARSRGCPSATPLAPSPGGRPYGLAAIQPKSNHRHFVSHDLPATRRPDAGRVRTCASSSFRLCLRVVRDGGEEKPTSLLRTKKSSQAIPGYSGQARSGQHSRGHMRARDDGRERPPRGSTLRLAGGWRSLYFFLGRIAPTSTARETTTAFAFAAIFTAGQSGRTFTLHRCIIVFSDAESRCPGTGVLILHVATGRICGQARPSKALHQRSASQLRVRMSHESSRRGWCVARGITLPMAAVPVNLKPALCIHVILMLTFTCLIRALQVSSG